MIRFAAELQDGQHAVVIALARDDLLALGTGMPIVFEPEETAALGLPASTVIMIFGGDSNEQLAEDFRAAGMTAL